ncbi:hypothetical protein A2Z00_03235 [Candidatus Gottesmanbacteria bacterium RBG_13_45_10]|uniref:Glycosyltransferase 2-like domain-containing protein n=1 Tax=Candidatus Gottesmanbacteria bacterium RBG_13_45_10 TaxID=1798370 RepID=A0A1F5ZIS3_9BACT|nr:MAG: hypothetical protein A2Z00_03235 [Candidatus Gottesmanbacteria bacterium RBG_13_45_10]
MEKLRFSVIIPTLNEEKFLPHLLTSLTVQTVGDFEVIVVDGTSSDRTIAVASTFKKQLPHLTVIRSDKPGVSRQRNVGAKTAKASWLVFVDADSVLLPNFFERISWYIDKKHPKFFTTWFRTDRDDSGDAIAGFIGNIALESMVLIDRPWAPGPLTVVRRDVFAMVGGYDENTSFGEDHDLSMMIYERGVPFQIFREILYIYSLRRFRKEGTLKVLERNLKSAFSVIMTKRGPKHMPGFIPGGILCKHDGEKKQKKKLQLGLSAFEKSVKKFIQEFVT